ncbi:MAG: YdeI/OmpD-associated family protein, partial [Bacteroidales bacterium]|nr:YdeI/OmpD-associated family protein [Bacteroidales bacterium]
MKYAKSVVEYLNKHPEWEDALLQLVSIAKSTGLEETIKWGAPTYTYKGKNIVGMAAFKSYVGLWFHQGALLKDPAKKLINAQEGTTKALRQWRFSSSDEIENDLVKSYIIEALENQKKGLELKPEPKAEIEIPDELEEAFESDTNLSNKFKQLTNFKQREFIEYVAQAKMEDTRQKRVDKVIPMILDGIGLNDKYRK